MIFLNQLFDTDLLPNHFEHQLPTPFKLLSELSIIILWSDCFHAGAILEHQVVKPLKLDLVFVFHSDAKSTEHV